MLLINTSDVSSVNIFCDEIVDYSEYKKMPHAVIKREGTNDEFAKFYTFNKINAKEILIDIKELESMAKRHAIKAITSDGETEDDYDYFMKNGSEKFQVCELYEDYPDESLIEQLEVEFQSSFSLIKHSYLLLGIVL